MPRLWFYQDTFASTLEDPNFAATLWLGSHPIPGAFYYGAKFDMALNNGHHEQIDPARHHLPAWLLPEIEAFSANQTGDSSQV